ncbi:guanitoxin biosynthesis heme-dependent pre-guanitoxin N-hydroxylase GntA [Actinophytocola xanthii]|uniref:YqcI/YcgG family protein n=1 Tax=Actinophytocola xanthii TaxID=1912961 RepID=A0A1Q8CK29_9PSEU|nr:guanitoxin biosynthesis heme-dependent pre-guanitoxin N-hydroxylase GntA [Actinophytocola xanthii]OLF14696.1 hypothetical protein BU204_25740 [Actinophytocola xanthii]
MDRFDGCEGTAFGRRPTGTVPDPVKDLVQDQLHGLVSARTFPCLGARSALASGNYLFNVYEDMESADSLLALAEDLRHFAGVRLGMGDFYTHVAAFLEPRMIQDESVWERQLWGLLQRLHDIDESPWDDRFSTDPTSPEFALSFAGLGHLVVTLYPGANRFARRFAWPTLVFNPLEQDRAKFPEDEALLRFQGRIRARDARLQGEVNPALPKTLDDPQAPGFSGAPVTSDWRCPLRVRANPPEKP